MVQIDKRNKVKYIMIGSSACIVLLLFFIICINKENDAGVVAGYQELQNYENTDVAVAEDQLEKLQEKKKAQQEKEKKEKAAKKAAKKKAAQAKKIEETVMKTPGAYKKIFAHSQGLVCELLRSIFDVILLGNLSGRPALLLR